MTLPTPTHHSDSTYPPTSFQIYLFTYILFFCDGLLPSQFTRFPSTIFFFLLTSVTHLISFISFFLFLFFLNLTIPSVLLIFFASFSDLLHHFLFLFFFFSLQIHARISYQKANFFTDIVISYYKFFFLNSYYRFLSKFHFPI